MEMPKFECHENEKSFLVEIKSIFHNYLRAEMEMPKFECHENEKSFLVEIKSIFHNYLRAIIW